MKKQNIKEYNFSLFFNTSFLTSKDVHWLSVFENRAWKEIFMPTNE